MEDPTHDFGTGLRAHLGLEQTALDLLAGAPVPRAEPPADGTAESEREAEDGATSTLETLVAFEHELLERERELARREKALAARAGSLLAAAQSLHDEVVGASKPRDELARMRRRRSGAA